MPFLNEEYNNPNQIIFLNTYYPYLVRHSKIAKLTNGGDRNQEVHLQSIHLENSHLIEGKTVLILDDVTTTYNSLFACQKILLDHGAKKVNCLAIGETGGY